MKKRKFSFNLIFAFLFLFPLWIQSFAQEAPKVILTKCDNYPDFHCHKKGKIESLQICFSVLFTGRPPFDAKIEIIDINTGYVYIGAAHKIDNWWGNPDPQPHIYTDSIQILINPEYNVPTKLKLEIVEYMDNNTTVWLKTGIDGEVLIDVYNIPEPKFLNDTIVSCPETVKLEVIPCEDGDVFKWRIEGEVGKFDSDYEKFANFTAPPDEDYYQIFFEQTNSMCSTEIPLAVKILGSPKGTISSDSEICGNGQAEIVFDFSKTTTPHFPYTVIYTDGTENFTAIINSEIETITRTVSGYKEFVFDSVIDDYNCDAEKEDLEGTAIITNIKPFADAEFDEEYGELFDGKICGNEIKLSANHPLESQRGEWSSSIEGEFIAGKDISNPIFKSNNKYGDFTLEWTIYVDDKNCSTTDVINVTFSEMPDVFAGDTIIIYSDKFQLNANEPKEGMTGFWEVLIGNCIIANPELHNSIATGFNKGESKLRWNVENGSCFDFDDVIIQYKDIRCPTAFSPNNDGKNDTFIIQGAEEVKNNMLIIFDKNGKVVFREANYGHNGKFWDGTENGKPVPDGTYNYVFSGDGIKTVRNFLLIKR